MVYIYSCNALSLLVEWQEGHPACKNIAPAISKVSFEDLWGTLPNWAKFVEKKAG